MARDALFDLAVNRACAYLLRFGPGGALGEARGRRLETWYRSTRFAYRIPLERVLECLESYPGPGHFWRGGEAGAWAKGENPRP